MPCYSPLRAFRGSKDRETGKRPLVFQRSGAVGTAGEGIEEIDVPCGKCIGCRLEYARQWAIRCMHESSMHEVNSFVTLTYNDDNIPAGHSLYKPDMQKFLKRLRYHSQTPIRYYYAGEYGEKDLRPHYHACLFGYYPEDAKFYKMAKNGIDRLYISQSLDEIWGNGFCSFGNVTFESAGYVARYCMKKLTRPRRCNKCEETGEECDDCRKVRLHYERVDPETGEIYSVSEEFADMSRRPGIGRDWIGCYEEEVFAHDSVIVNGKEVLPPKYYDSTLSEEDLQVVKERRVKRAADSADERTLARLRVREEVKQAAINLLGRD